MTRTPYDRQEDASGLRLVGQTDLNGHGDCMHIARKGSYAYVGHMGDDGMGTSIVDVSDPGHPRVITQLPAAAGSHSHKVQIVDDIMLVNHERYRGAPRWTAGLAIHDLANPVAPRQIGFLPIAGNGVHRMTYWEPPYAYLAASEDGYEGQILIVADLSDPSSPREIGRWWLHGQWRAGGEEPTWPEGRLANFHQAIVLGERAYCGWWDLGIVILDLADPSRPRLVSHLEFGAEVSGATHTARPLPGTSVMAVTDESIEDIDREKVRKRARLVDIADERNPRVISLLPEPEGDFPARGGRFGPHNLHEMEPGSMVDPATLYVTYFSAGLRVYDVGDPTRPREVAHYIPEAPPGPRPIQINGVFVDASGLILITDRFSGGLYLLERV